jgi:hypothetical protein
VTTPSDDTIPGAGIPERSLLLEAWDRIRRADAALEEVLSRVDDLEELAGDLGELGSDYRAIASKIRAAIVTGYTSTSDTDRTPRRALLS